MKEKLKKGLEWFYESNIWIGLLLLIGDIISKNLIVKYKDNIFAGGGRNGGIDIIPGFLGINYLINENVAFGVSLGSPLANKIVFSIFAIIISAAIIVYLVFKWKKTRRLYKAIAFMVIAGAIGNCIDRLFYSASYLDMGGKQGVVDWIDFYGIWSFNFNVADCAVVIAAIMLLVVIIVDAIKESIANAKKIEKETGPVEKVKSRTEIETQELREKDSHKNE